MVGYDTKKWEFSTRGVLNTYENIEAKAYVMIAPKTDKVSISI